MVDQSRIFEKSEGDAWYKRNFLTMNKNLFKKDNLLSELEKIIRKYKKKKINILEIGCSHGRVLNYLKVKFPQVNVFGLEPSKIAIKNKLSNKLHIKHGTARKIPFVNKKFDLLIFGASLNYCDSKDLMSIANEANRVTKSEAYIAIEDWYSKNTEYSKYEHQKAMFVRKMNYSKIFLWHPFYSLVVRRVFKYKKGKVLKKHQHLSNLWSIFILKKKEI